MVHSAIRFTPLAVYSALLADLPHDGAVRLLRLCQDFEGRGTILREQSAAQLVVESNGRLVHSLVPPDADRLGLMVCRYVAAFLRDAFSIVVTYGTRAQTRQRQDILLRMAEKHIWRWLISNSPVRLNLGRSDWERLSSEARQSAAAITSSRSNTVARGSLAELFRTARDAYLPQTGMVLTQSRFARIAGVAIGTFHRNLTGHHQARPSTLEEYREAFIRILGTPVMIDDQRAAARRADRSGSTKTNTRRNEEALRRVDHM